MFGKQIDGIVKYSAEIPKVEKKVGEREEKYPEVVEGIGGLPVIEIRTRKVDIKEFVDDTGWLPVVLDHPEIDKRTHQIGDMVVTVEANRIVHSWPVLARKPTANDVRAEARRRMIALVGARDEAHLAIIISNAQREAIRLNTVKIGADKPAREWTSGEKARAAQLLAIDQKIEDIREASNFMEPDPPVDFADDSNWP